MGNQIPSHDDLQLGNTRLAVVWSHISQLASVCRLGQTSKQEHTKLVKHTF